MASVRLTSTSRDLIEDRLIDQRFGARKDDVEERSFRLAQAVYEDVYGKDLERMLALPERWLPRSNTLHVQFAASFDRLTFGRPDSTTLKRPSRRFQQLHLDGRVFASYDASHFFTTTHEKIERDREELKSEEKTARSKIRAMLASVSSTKKLVEIWPEVAPFLDDVGRPEPKLPAIPIDELNGLLGLETKEAA